MGYKKILVPLDGSELAESALAHIPALADPGARIHLVSVLAEEPLREIAVAAAAIGYSYSTSVESWPPVSSSVDPEEVRARQNYLNQLAESLSLKGYWVTTEIRTGDVVTAIEDASDGCDVVLLATHGRTGLSRFILGSVSEGILHRVLCPVLVV
jgi:nucleotide-binding universal stress UspA family protein